MSNPVGATRRAALQLRLVEVAAEKNSTLVLPFPVELPRFLDRAATTDKTPGASAGEGDRPTA